MGEHPQWLSTVGGQCYRYLRKPGNWYQKADKNRKNKIILGTIILALGASLLILGFSEKEAYAKEGKSKQAESVKAEELDPLSRIGRGQKIGGEAAMPKICREDKTSKPAPVKKPEARNQKFLELVTGHPIEKMLPHIEKRNAEVAAYLIAIARKESSWGKHSPKKDGRECFNF